MDPNNNETPMTNPAAPEPVTPNPELTTPTPEPIVVNPGATSAPASTPLPEPVSPVVQGSESATANPEPVVTVPEPTAQPANPVINPSATTNSEPMSSLYEPTNGVAAMDPIMMPEPAKAPDPVEEELKAPMTPAEPVPGSIGSAVSGPTGEMTGMPAENPFSNTGQTPSVSFNDPAMQPDPTAMGGATTGGAIGGATKSQKKISSRTTLIALIVVAGMVVIALAAVLIIQLMNNNTAQTTPNNPTVIEPDNSSNNSNNGNSSTSANNTLSCTRNMTQAEIARYNDAVSGTVNISAEFTSDNLLSMITRVDSVVYSDEDAVSNEPVETETHEATAEDLTSTNAVTYSLPVDQSGTLDLTKTGIQSNYQSLDFTCEQL